MTHEHRLLGTWLTRLGWSDAQWFFGEVQWVRPSNR